jgi:hypothetical protein
MICYRAETTFANLLQEYLSIQEPQMKKECCKTNNQYSSRFVAGL